MFLYAKDEILRIIVKLCNYGEYKAYLAYLASLWWENCFFYNSSGIYNGCQKGEHRAMLVLVYHGIVMLLKVSDLL